MPKKFIVRSVSRDFLIDSERELQAMLLGGKVSPGDFMYDEEIKVWFRVGDYKSFAALAVKPNMQIDRKIIYFFPLNAVIPQGPYSLKEIQQKIQEQQLSEHSWVMVDGDKDWRQVKNLKLLLDFLPKLPTDQPTIVATAPPDQKDSGLIPIDMPEDNTDPTAELYVEKEEETKAISSLGLIHTPPPAPAQAKAEPPAMKPAMPPKPNIPAMKQKGAGESAEKGKGEEQGFEGITAEISSSPIWMIKVSDSEAVAGPYKFLDIIRFLDEGRITRNDKISKVGTNRFVKIQQQYEFNVKYSIETVVVNGVEQQKILIRRRHPRVPYITGAQVVSRLGISAGNCMNISGGGILIEVPKVEFNLGEIIDVKLMPGLIPRTISCKALVIGKVSKTPPGYALKFEELKNEDKEAIEYFVTEALKREMA